MGPARGSLRPTARHPRRLPRPPAHALAFACARDGFRLLDARGRPGAGGDVVVAPYATPARPKSPSRSGASPTRRTSSCWPTTGPWPAPRISPPPCIAWRPWSGSRRWPCWRNVSAAASGSPCRTCASSADPDSSAQKIGGGLSLPRFHVTLCRTRIPPKRRTRRRSYCRRAPCSCRRRWTCSARSRWLRRR